MLSGSEGFIPPRFPLGHSLPTPLLCSQKVLMVCSVGTFSLRKSCPVAGRLFPVVCGLSLARFFPASYSGLLSIRSTVSARFASPCIERNRHLQAPGLRATSSMQAVSRSRNPWTARIGEKADHLAGNLARNASRLIRSNQHPGRAKSVRTPDPGPCMPGSSIPDRRSSFGDLPSLFPLVTCA